MGGSAGQSENAADKFFFIAVPEFDPTFTEAARTSATLALRAAGRLEGLLGRLDQFVPQLASCTSGHHLARNDQRPAVLSQMHSLKHAGTSKSAARDSSSAAAAATRSMIEQLKI